MISRYFPPDFHTRSQIVSTKRVWEAEGGDCVLFNHFATYRKLKRGEGKTSRRFLALKFKGLCFVPPLMSFREESFNARKRRNNWEGSLLNFVKASANAKLRPQLRRVSKVRIGKTPENSIINKHIREYISINFSFYLDVEIQYFFILF